MGIVALNRGDLVAARLLNAESLVIRRELVDRTGIADSLEGFAAVAWACEKPSTAARLWGAATHLREEIGAPLAPSERADYDRLVAAARAAAGPKAFDRAWQEGGALRVECQAPR
jgi:hypothetical protein